MQRCFDISVSGNVADWDDMDNISGRVKLSGRVIDPGAFRPTVEQAVWAYRSLCLRWLSAVM